MVFCTSSRLFDKLPLFESLSSSSRRASIMPETERNLLTVLEALAVEAPATLYDEGTSRHPASEIYHQQQERNLAPGHCVVKTQRYNE